jgi:putative membrane protein
MATALAVVTALAVAAAFANGRRRLRRRGRSDLVGRDRVALLSLSLGLWLVALSPPLDKLADSLLAAHMLEHVLIADAAPALVLLAVRGPLCFFLLPRGAVARLARVRAVRALTSFFLRPAVAFVVWASSIAVWHVPALYDAALESQALHGLEHASFVFGGVLVWLQLVDPARRRTALAPRLRFAYALGMLAVGAALTNTLILNYTPVYPAYAAQTNRPFGLSGLGDQDLAGLIMMAEQLLTVGTVAVVMLRRTFAAPFVAQPDRHPLAI